MSCHEPAEWVKEIPEFFDGARNGWRFATVTDSRTGRWKLP